jgi:hypothetical protein
LRPVATGIAWDGFRRQNLLDGVKMGFGSVNSFMLDFHCRATICPMILVNGGEQEKKVDANFDGIPIGNWEQQTCMTMLSPP